MVLSQGPSNVQSKFFQDTHRQLADPFEERFGRILASLRMVYCSIHFLNVADVLHVAGANLYVRRVLNRDVLLKENR